MEMLGDTGHVESRFGPFGDGVSVGAKQVHGLRQTYHRLRNHFGHNRWYSYVTRLKWKLVLVYLEIVLILTHDTYMVCAKRTIGLETVLDAPMVLQGDKAQVQAHFGLCRNSTSLDAPDGTRRRHGSCRIMFRFIWR